MNSEEMKAKGKTMHDVNGKEFKAGDFVNVPCKVVSVNQVADHYVLDLELKYTDKPYHDVKAIDDISNNQVIKLE